MAKYYAVRRGRKPGIYRTWDQAKAQVQGYSQAEFKSFTDPDQAQAFMAGGSNRLGSSPGNEEADKGQEMTVYVDGSYDAQSGYYGYGGVVFFQGQKQIYKGSQNKPGLQDMRNVAGEIIGAMQAVKLAKQAGAKSLAIYYDYQGISKWTLEEWQAKNPYTQAYRDYMQAASQDLAISFHKVQAHTGDQYNEEADRLAKLAIRQALKN
ncbi:ribonuclease H [Aerococcus urinaehominis]|uniref:ribonuclease H n=1 Tax=Aerococcus urinaehominis TaxID=128944 RepID=A0A109RGP9_9LACT|nr:ribonuclease H family protein [Aerococcus urinaehominis]AMB98841.1 ribonuclease H [Aerococcus urinaehominis]SDM17596.1 ribonuclease HI [Aerococcus urinaehominis]